MKRREFFVVACVLAFTMPFLVKDGSESSQERPTPAWPRQFDGRVLTQMKLSSLEAGFAKGFPGQIGKFSDGKRGVIIRWITAPTRKLHDAADCFKASGYLVKPLAMGDVLNNGERWSRFSAVRGEESFIVSQRIVDQSTGTWTDASSWYWAALLGKSSGPWWAYTVVERARMGNRFSEHEAF